jgi:hypothetical protein
MPKLLKLASGGTEAIALAAEQTGESSHDVQAAAIFFLQQMLVRPGLDNYSTLGLRPGASVNQIKEHKRLLLLWLHPDKNHNSWETLLLQRVIAAAKFLEQSDKSSAPPPGVTADAVSSGKIHRSTRPKRSWGQKKHHLPWWHRHCDSGTRFVPYRQ